MRALDGVVKRYPTLLIAPMSVVSNWAAEAAKFTPDLKVKVLHGANRPRGEELKRVAEGADLVMTTYGVVARDPGEWGAVQWDHVILDEAQAVKNPNTAASRAVRSLPARRRTSQRRCAIMRASARSESNSSPTPTVSLTRVSSFGRPVRRMSRTTSSNANRTSEQH